MFARRFAIASSFVSKLKIQKLSTSSETADPSLSKMKKKQKKVITGPSLSKRKLQEAMKKQNDADMVLTGKVISSEARKSNFVFSPASINTALTMEEAACSSASEERKAVFSEIATVVFADGRATGGPKITAINGIWVEQSLPVDDSLKDLFVNAFKATFTRVDFRSKAEQVRMEVNKWASDNTNGLINNLLPPRSVKSNTGWIYGNALYFKGAWQHKFPKSLTKDRDFHLLNGTSVSVPFMSSHCNYQYIEDYDGFKVLILPFRQGRVDNNRRFSMHFYLPDEKDGLDNLVKKMTSTPRFVDDHIPSFRAKVGDFEIPKFKISFGFEASRLFNRLGLNEAALYHKACVEIDEEGAEAAAAAIICVPLSLTNYKIDFVADHPFLFLIREDRTGTVLFAGQVFDPSKSS